MMLAGGGCVNGQFAKYARGAERRESTCSGFRICEKKGQALVMIRDVAKNGVPPEIGKPDVGRASVVERAIVARVIEIASIDEALEKGVE